jgi:glyceraldehyde 3-phosphate dehydrogenase
MSIKVGINGFGRIGRVILRAAIARGDMDVLGLNAPDKTPDQVSYLFKYDTVHGRYQGEVNCDHNNLTIDGKKIALLSSRNPKELKWGELGIDYVLECTGKFLTAEAAKSHLAAGAKAVVISAPAKDSTPMLVYGVNHLGYNPENVIVSAASCTTNCLAPVAKVLSDSFGIVEGLMTTIHACTASQSPVDSYSRKNMRLGRSIGDNIIPASTGAAKAVGKVIPELNGKLTGMAMRVPTLDVSVVDLTVRLAKQATYAEVCAAMKAASEGAMRGVLGYEEGELVSSDFRTDPRPSIFDAKAGIALNDQFMKLIAWYDNEWGFSCNMLRLVDYIAGMRGDK